jgi:hypothetical protein
VVLAEKVGSIGINRNGINFSRNCMIRKVPEMVR